MHDILEIKQGGQYSWSGGREMSKVLQAQLLVRKVGLEPVLLQWRAWPLGGAHLGLGDKSHGGFWVMVNSRCSYFLQFCFLICLHVPSTITSMHTVLRSLTLNRRQYFSLAHLILQESPIMLCCPWRVAGTWRSPGPKIFPCLSHSRSSS